MVPEDTVNKTIAPTQPKYLARFLSKLNIPSGNKDACWLYTGCKFKNGYGCYASDIDSYAHRYAHKAFLGPIAAGEQVQHTCPGGGNKACCNPLHLKTGTPAINSADAVKAGLYKVPRRSYVRATPAEIEDIRKSAAAGESNYSIAARLDRSVPYVSRVLSGSIHSGKPRKPRTPSIPDLTAMKATTKRLTNVYDRLGMQLAREAQRVEKKVT
jgi:hypothetical protein